jgi:hypothetical protein
LMKADDQMMIKAHLDSMALVASTSPLYQRDLS